MAFPWQNVTGTVDIELFKGKASIRSRSSPLSLYSEVLYDQHASVWCVHTHAHHLVAYVWQAIASMDSIGAYDPTDAAGFININAHRLRAHTYRENSLKGGKSE